MRPGSPLSGAQVKAFLFYYFYYFGSFCDLVFKQQKRHTITRSVLKVLWIFWEMLDRNMYEQLFGTLLEAMRKTSYVLVLEKERNQFHCTSALRKSNTTFLHRHWSMSEGQW